VAAIQVADPLLSSMALVRASAELNFTASVQSLAAGISTLALAATAIPGGLLADRLGRRGLLMIAMIVAAAGQLVTAASPDELVYLLGRVITGMALGVVFGASYGMLRDVSAAKSLGPAMATFNVLNGVVPVVALVLGGVLIGVDWRLAYLMLPVIALACFFFVPALLPKVARIPREGKTDLWGMLLLAIGIVGILYGISMATHGLDSPTFWAPIAVALVSLVLFWFREKKAGSPAFPIRLLAHPAFLGAVVMGIFWNVASASASQMLPNVWQYVTHLHPSQIGAAALPEAAAGIIGSVVAGMALGRGSKARTMAIIGYAMMAVAFFSFFLLTPTASYFLFIPGMVLAGCGWMMNATSQGNLFITLSPAKFYGPVTSSKMAVGQFGYSLGLSGTTVAVSSLTLSGVSDLTKGAVSGEANWDAITTYMANPTSVPTDAALAAVSSADVQAVYMNAFGTTSLVVAILLAVFGTLMYVLLKRKGADVPTDVFLGLAPATRKAN
jgi:predicted MFS family arabinose efflux permease